MVTCAQVGDSDQFPPLHEGMGFSSQRQRRCGHRGQQRGADGQQVSVGRQYWAGLALGMGAVPSSFSSRLSSLALSVYRSPRSHCAWSSFLLVSLKPFGKLFCP